VRREYVEAICIRRNANGAMPLRLALGLGIGLGSGFDYFRHCAICIAPNTDSPMLTVGCCLPAVLVVEDTTDDCSDSDTADDDLMTNP